MSTAEEVVYAISIVIVVASVIRWIMRRDVPSHDTVWWEFAAIAAGLSLVQFNWRDQDWLGLAIIGLWTIMKFVHFNRALDADKKKKLTDISG